MLLNVHGTVMTNSVGLDILKILFELNRMFKKKYKIYFWEEI